MVYMHDELQMLMPRAILMREKIISHFCQKWKKLSVDCLPYRERSTKFQEGFISGGTLRLKSVLVYKFICTPVDYLWNAVSTVDAQYNKNEAQKIERIGHIFFSFTNYPKSKLLHSNDSCDGEHLKMKQLMIIKKIPNTYKQSMLILWLLFSWYMYNTSNLCLQKVLKDLEWHLESKVAFMLVNTKVLFTVVRFQCINNSCFSSSWQWHPEAQCYIHTCVVNVYTVSFAPVLNHRNPNISEWGTVCQLPLWRTACVHSTFLKVLCFFLS